MTRLTPPDDHCITIKQAANILSVSLTNFYQLLRDGNGPPHFRWGAGKTRPHIRFRVADFNKWVEDQIKAEAEKIKDETEKGTP